jgi:hypothetical protein
VSSGWRRASTHPTALTRCRCQSPSAVGAAERRILQPADNGRPQMGPHKINGRISSIRPFQNVWFGKCRASATRSGPPYACSRDPTPARRLYCKCSLDLSLLASSHCAPLRRATFRHATGRLESSVSLIRKSDVKTHLSTRTGKTSNVPPAPARSEAAPAPRKQSMEAHLAE